MGGGGRRRETGDRGSDPEQAQEREQEQALRGESPTGVGRPDGAAMDQAQDQDRDQGAAAMDQGLDQAEGAASSWMYAHCRAMPSGRSRRTARRASWSVL